MQATPEHGSTVAQSLPEKPGRQVQSDPLEERFSRNHLNENLNSHCFLMILLLFGFFFYSSLVFLFLIDEANPKSTKTLVKE